MAWSNFELQTWPNSVQSLFSGHKMVTMDKAKPREGGLFVWPAWPDPQVSPGAGSEDEHVTKVAQTYPLLL